MRPDRDCDRIAVCIRKAITKKLAKSEMRPARDCDLHSPEWAMSRILWAKRGKRPDWDCDSVVLVMLPL